MTTTPTGRTSTPDPSDAHNLDGRWRLSPDVSLRDEPFGALAYHHGTRRLVFLKSVALAGLVTRLGEFASAREAVDTVIDPAQRSRYVRALWSLAHAGVIDEC
ncbi:MAG: mycofactocin biosynthesis chaperone MftB [Acidimicrobiales bacterium]